MHVLALDTATETCGVAVTLNNQVLGSVHLTLEDTHAKVVMAAVEAVLDLCALRLDQIDLIAVTRGPGSFTGLRIGVATAKGMAMAVQKPLVSVSCLATLATQCVADTPLVCSMMDARRGQVYGCLYARTAEGMVPQGKEQVGVVEDLADQIRTPCSFIGSGAVLYADRLQGRLQAPFTLAAPLSHVIQPAVVARLGQLQWQLGATEDLAGFAPVYLRKSDAQPR
jgi:tRNA threonylcarbamoyladenosine biosynthesis protein TsaB